MRTSVVQDVPTNVRGFTMGKPCTEPALLYCLLCSQASDDMVTDMVLATQLTECDSTLTPCEAVCMASSALAGWHGNAARQHVQTVNDVNKTIKAVQVC